MLSEVPEDGRADAGARARQRQRDHAVAGSRGRPQPRLLRRAVRPAAEGGLEHRLRLGAPPLERPRHEGASRDRLQVPSRRATSRRCGARPAAQLRQRRRHRHQADGSRPAAARLHRAAGAHQDHVVRAAPARAGHADVPRSDLGLQHPDAELRRLRPQLGARLRLRRTTHAPLLPKGTILHIIGYMDNSPTNKNVPDPRNWQGSGNRSVANMFIDLGMGLTLTDEQFQAEMAKRREKMKLTQKDVFIGCPLCNVAPRLTPRGTTTTTRRDAAGSGRQTSGTIVRYQVIRSGDQAITRDQVQRMANANTRASGAGRGRARWSAASLLGCAVLLARAERVAGVRRLGAERRRLVQLPVRLHEPQLGRRARRADRSRQQHRARRPRSGTADALPAAPQPLHVPRARARRTGARRN